MSDLKKFWMVWSEQASAPTKKHFSPLEANQEASRLAKRHPDRIFYVLESVSEVLTCVVQRAHEEHHDL